MTTKQILAERDREAAQLNRLLQELGYAEYLGIISDPNDEQHEHMLGWRGKFDPELFSAEKTTKKMRSGLPDWRMMS